jgi:hypothetical protein
MDAGQINSAEKLREWLQDKPIEWAQWVALRAALKALPYIAHSGSDWRKKFALLPFGALFTSWMQLSNSWIFIRTDANRANARFGGESFDFKLYKSQTIAANAADASYHSADAQSRSMHLLSDCVQAVEKAAAAYGEDSKQKYGPDFGPSIAVTTFWGSIASDCQHISDWPGQHPAYQLSNYPLWDQLFPYWVQNLKPKLARKLLDIDQNYDVWIDWYERRIWGKRAAFDIPGDKRRVEDKRILRRLAEATDEDFWGKGHEYVNATLKGWLDEARARVAPPPDGELEPENRPFIEVPHPVSGATAFGLNSEGKLDPLPHYDQQLLRDLPNQRRAYIDVRAAAVELQEEGQRLGPKLTNRIDRFVTAFPEQFEDAEAWLIWSAAAALRTLYWKHKAVADSPDPDDAKLEPAVAVELRGLLDIYNVFAFGDDGLRQKDENSISPQERLKAEELAKLSKPVEQAIIDTAAIRTEITLAEIKENLNNVLLAFDTPYADQTFDQANKTTQNLAVGIFDGAKIILADPRAIGTELAKLGIKVAATTAATAAGYTAYNYAALIEFIAVNAEPLKAYAITVFQSYPHLPEIVDRIRLLWMRLTNKN